jgi:membrane-associated protease RseP (regulator of RpoE activity)
VNFGAAILGFAVLIFIHEAGHFLAARAVGMRPRKFYLGFPPALLKTTRGGVEYGIGAIPLGGYVKLPGMHRPAAGDLGASLQPSRAEELREPLAVLDRALWCGATTSPRSTSSGRSSPSSPGTA